MKNGNPDQPLEIKIIDNRLVISIGIDRLAFCADHSDDFNPYDAENNDWFQKWKVIDNLEFAKDIIRQLGDEAEDGSTLLNRLLDAMTIAAMEDGSIGIEECPDGTPNIWAQETAKEIE